MDVLRHTFRPEFLNRVDETVKSPPSVAQLTVNHSKNLSQALHAVAVAAGVGPANHLRQPR